MDEHRKGTTPDSLEVPSDQVVSTMGRECDCVRRMASLGSDDANSGDIYFITDHGVKPPRGSNCWHAPGFGEEMHLIAVGTVEADEDSNILLRSESDLAGESVMSGPK